MSSLDVLSALTPGFIDGMVATRKFRNYDSLSDLNLELRLTILSHMRCGWIEEDDLIPGILFGTGLAQYGVFGDGSADKRKYSRPYEIITNVGRIVDIAICSNCSIFLTANGDVYMCGSTQAIFGSKENWLTPRKIDMSFLPSDDKITALAGGSLHLCMLTRSGYVYTMGKGDSGQLGDGIMKTFHMLKIPTIIDPNMMLVEIDNINYYDRVVQVIANKTSTLLLTIYGRVYFVGIHNTLKAKTLIRVDTNILPSRVSKIALGADSFFFLTSCGRVYARSLKQIALKFPEQLKEILYDEAITELSVSTKHLLALGKSGFVYASGDGRYGRLGDGDETQHMMEPPFTLHPTSTNESSPSTNHGHIIINPEYFLDDKVTQVYAFDTYSCVITKSGALYAFGRGNYGILGDDNDEIHNLATPTRVGGTNLYYEKVRKVVSNGKQSLILTW